MSIDKIHVIACGVLATDINHVAREHKIEVQTTWMPGGLHSNPKELRRRLQEAIDAVSASGGVRQIAIGYGVCGRGAVGIHARHVPLVIPRVHDCIALFLGSDAAYRREFAKYPGTYYISAGWVREKVQPSSTSETGGVKPCSPGREGEAPAEPSAPGAPDSVGASPSEAAKEPPSESGSGGSGDPRPAAQGADGCDCADPEFQKLVAKHGLEDAQAIRQFLSSWQRNYQRAAFIDTGAAEHRRYARIAQDMASQHGWKYEALPGSGDLLKKVLLASASDSEVLWVPPHHVTVYDPISRGLQAVPVWQAGRQADPAQDEIIEIGDATPADGNVAIGAGPQVRLGLGIDAGGTYTDVVIYEFAGDRVLQKAKALTTRWDFTIGISEALDQLDPARLAQVDLVSVSTTLATNAIVEGRGQKVGLLIMPPYGLFYDDDITHRPIQIVRGQLEIDGVERAPIDPAEIRRAARKLVDEEHVGAFAVAGYASHANPVHEMQIRKILEQETGLPVTCGHDVSEQLDYTVRAQTAALNGRIIPILVSFLEQAGQCLRQRGIDAPMMVVRSDGSLMSVQTARTRPIETILSGPAASVAGASYLTKLRTAFVVDVGGTTTDTAMIVGGSVRTNRHGARVGGWQTHVQALDMRTCGLGGDSLIAFANGELRLGPRRVAPAAWLGGRDGLSDCLRWIEEHIDHYGSMPNLMDLYALNGQPVGFGLTEREKRLVDALSRRPHSGHELASRVQQHWWENLDLDRLEREHLVQRCGLTPTDLLHVTGQFQRWDTAAARRMLSLLARAVGLDEQRLTERVMDTFVRRLAMEVLKKQLDEQTDADGIDRSDVCRALTANWLSGGAGPAGAAGDYHVRIKLRHPIVGIGAPVGHFLPAAAKLLETEGLVPEYADVANAIGAITSSVSIRRQVEICPDVNGRYALYGIEGAPTFAELHEARAAAIKSLRVTVTEAARAAGTSQARIRFVIHDNVAPMADGGQIFIAQTIEARLSGRPDLARVAPSC